VKNNPKRYQKGKALPPVTREVRPYLFGLFVCILFGATVRADICVDRFGRILLHPLSEAGIPPSQLPKSFLDFLAQKKIVQPVGQQSTPQLSEKTSQTDLWETAKALEDIIYPDWFEHHFSLRFERAEEIPGPGAKYVYFAPSHQFNPKFPLITAECVHGLQHGKKMLSVGAGPANLETLLVLGFKVDPSQIELADFKSYEAAPFKHHTFDMHGAWPIFEKKFDFVVFPESILLNSTSHSLSGREDNLCQLIQSAASALNPHGQIRINGLSLFPSQDEPALRRRIENLLPGAEIKFYSRGAILTGIEVRVP
jgi:hypothetical protein